MIKTILLGTLGMADEFWAIFVPHMSQPPSWKGRSLEMSVGEITKAPTKAKERELGHPSKTENFLEKNSCSTGLPSISQG